MTGPAYEYRATLRRVVDGDTLDLDVDMGFEIRAITRVRLLGVNTPEVVGASRARGLEAAAFVQQWFAQHNGQALIRSYKSRLREKYGRWLAAVFPPDGSGDSLSTELLSRGFAVPMDDRGGTP